MDATTPVIDNTLKYRFELTEGAYTAYADYHRAPGVLTIKYVFAPDELRGTGAAGRLMAGIVEIARTEELKIVPLCGYAASWLRKHKEHHALVQ